MKHNDLSELAKKLHEALKGKCEPNRADLIYKSQTDCFHHGVTAATDAAVAMFLGIRDTVHNDELDFKAFKMLGLELDDGYPGCATITDMTQLLIDEKRQLQHEVALLMDNNIKLVKLLKRTAEVNETMQNSHGNGSAPWHDHETIDDRLFDCLEILGD